MKVALPKLDKLAIAVICGWVLFLLVILYAAYFLDSSYNQLNTQTNASKILHVTRIDRGAFSKAVGRFTSTLSYTPQANPVADPFSVVVPGVVGTP